MNAEDGRRRRDEEGENGRDGNGALGSEKRNARDRLELENGWAREVVMDENERRRKRREGREEKERSENFFHL